MIYTKNFFSGFGDTKLFYQYWKPETDPPGVIVFVHGGSGDHSSRNKNLINFLTGANYAFYTFDCRGAGLSEGKKGYIPHWDAYRKDLSLFINLIKKDYPRHPLFLLGNSIGGAIVLDYGLRFPEDLTGMACSAPAIGKVKISPVLWVVGLILTRIWPWCPVKSGIDLRALSRDPQVMEAAIKDPLYHGLVTPRFGMELKKTVQWIHQNASSLKLPLLILHGMDDGIINIEGSRRFARNAQNARLIEYPGARHELYNEINKEEILTELLKWIQSTTDASKITV